jgi:hypothetical protein
MTEDDSQELPVQTRFRNTFLYISKAIPLGNQHCVSVQDQDQERAMER